MAGETILIVDDERCILKILEYNVRKSGYQIRLAQDGVEAMKSVREQKPDLILLDVMMPHKNGYEVCKEIREDPDLKDILIILITAKGQEIDRDIGLEVGANHYATKPFSPNALLRTVRDLLDER